MSWDIISRIEELVMGFSKQAGGYALGIYPLCYAIDAPFQQGSRSVACTAAKRKRKKHLYRQAGGGRHCLAKG